MQLENSSGSRINLAFSDFELITKADSDLEKVAKGFRLENVADGDTLKMTAENGGVITFNLKASDHGYHAGHIKRFWSTGSSGSYRIIALY